MLLSSSYMLSLINGILKVATVSVNMRYAQVGHEELNICAYESIITLNRANVLHFLSQSEKWAGFRVRGIANYANEMAMPEDELNELKDDMMRQMENVAQRWRDTRDYLSCHCYMQDMFSEGYSPRC